jgi:hypothetical protein
MHTHRIVLIMRSTDVVVCFNGLTMKNNQRVLRLLIPVAAWF